MKKLITMCIIAAMLIVGNTRLLSGQDPAGRIVAVSDEWCLGDSFNSPGNDGATFALNTFEWITAPSGNRSILLDDNYRAHNLDLLVGTLNGAGYTITESDPVTWTSGTFSGYGAVLWERGLGNGVNFNGSELVSYVHSGGGVLVIGGGTEADYPHEQHNNFLNAFGVDELPGVGGDSYTITQFSPHPVTTGLSSLIAVGPSYMTLLPGSGAEVISQQDNINWVVTVPEPGTICLLGLGVLGLLRRRKA